MNSQTPHSLLSGYFAQRGLSPTANAAFRSVCGLAGVTATFLFPVLRRRIWLLGDTKP